MNGVKLYALLLRGKCNGFDECCAKKRDNAWSRWMMMSGTKQPRDVGGFSCSYPPTTREFGRKAVPQIV